MKRGIDLAVQTIVDELKSKSRKITSNDEIAQVATVSANGDTEISRMIAEAMEKVGRGGVITVARFKVGILMRALYGQGTPKQAAEVNKAAVFAIQTDAALIVGLVVPCDSEIAALILDRPKLALGLKTRLLQRAVNPNIFGAGD